MSDEGRPADGALSLSSNLAHPTHHISSTKMARKLPPECDFLNLTCADEIAKLNVPNRITLSGRQISLLDASHREHLYKVLRTEQGHFIPGDAFIRDALDRLPDPETETKQDLPQEVVDKAKELGIGEECETYGPLHVLRTTRVTDTAVEEQFQWAIDDKVIFPLKNTSDGADPNFTVLPPSPRIALLINSILYHLVLCLEHQSNGLRVNLCHAVLEGHIWASAALGVRICYLEIPLLPSLTNLTEAGYVTDDLTPYDGPQHELVAQVDGQAGGWQHANSHLPKNGGEGWRRSFLIKIQEQTQKDGIAVAQALGFLLPVPSVEPRDKSTETHMSTAERQATVRLMHRMAKQKLTASCGDMQCALCEFRDRQEHLVIVVSPTGKS